MGLIAQSGIGWPCAECGEQVNKTVAWLKANHNYTCEACGKTSTINAANRERYLANTKYLEETIADFSRGAIPTKEKN